MGISAKLRRLRSTVSPIQEQPQDVDCSVHVPWDGILCFDPVAHCSSRVLDLYDLSLQMRFTVSICCCYGTQVPVECCLDTTALNFVESRTAVRARYQPGVIESQGEKAVLADSCWQTAV